jgi:hypothetical protein
MIKIMKGLAVLSATCLLQIAPFTRADDTNQAQPTSTPAVPGPVIGSTTIFSPFGIGADAHTGATAKAYAKWLPQMSAIGLTEMRTPNITWWEVEGGQEGTWHWANVDEQMDYLEARPMQYGALLYGNPHWNTQDARGNLPVNNVSAWSDYVTGVVQHVKGRIKFFEVWNEPPNGTGRNQTPADYGKLLAATYDAAHAVDPTCLVGLAAKSVDVNYLDRAIQGGGKDHFDYIVLHPYEVLGISTRYPGTEAIYMNIVPTVRKMLAAQDPAKAGVPIIFTELGSDAGKDANKPACDLVKAYAMGIAEGVACINWFEGMDGDSGPMGLLQANGTPRPAYTAMAQMIKYLGEHPTCLGWVLLNDKDYGFVFQGAKGTVMVAWAPKGTSDQIDLGQPVTIVDPLTGTTTHANTCALTAVPILVDGVPSNLVTQAQSDKTKPFPWDGDYTDAKSVSVTYGETNVEQGLHTQSAAAIAADVVAYGGSARSGGVPGGTVFMVDPNFLSYTATPIEISVVVRRDAAHDNAGFKLVYESTSGYKSCGWYTVPDNNEWNTVKWKITDDELVSMWGYNFSLNSDGNRYNKYDIQSITVTKLDQ